MTSPAAEPQASSPEPMELRIHGRGGQGGVSCAKILAAVYAKVGLFVQAFGDYGGERSGAPVRAFLRTAREPIRSRNKVARPDHLLVLDESLLGPTISAGLASGGLLLVNSQQSPEAVGASFPSSRVACVDAYAIARRHGIGTRAVVIVNTTMIGAAARLFGLPMAAVVETFANLGLAHDLPAAAEAYEAVRVRPPTVATAPGEAATSAVGGAAAPEWAKAAMGPVLDVTELRTGHRPVMTTGGWSTSRPRHVDWPAPCVAACPAGNDVVGFVQALAEGDVDGAALLLAATSPLPGVCGRVCPGFCMRQCSRGELDEPVDVRALERWLGDHLPDDLGDRLLRARDGRSGSAPFGPTATATPRRIAVIGGGPAGLSASYALALAGHAVTLVDAGPRLGGLLVTGIPGYRLPSALVDREVSRIVALGVHVRLDERLDATRVDALLGEHDGLVLAAGLQSPTTTHVPGAELPGVEQALGLLGRVARGDRTPLTGRVLVVGGGNTAVDAARVALRLGASEVVLAYRRTRAEMPALAEEAEHALEEGVALRTQRVPIAFVGDRQVRAVVLGETELGEPDERGRRRPILTDRAAELACDHVLLALGQQLDSSIWPSDWTLVEGRFHRAGSPLAAFACGDLLTAAGSVSHAIGSGRRAADALVRSLEPSLGVGLARDGAVSQVSKANEPGPVPAVRVDRFERLPPGAPPVLEAAGRVAGFAEVRGGLPDAAEAHRCLSCGRCTGCDRCLWFCPDGLIVRRGSAQGRPRYEVDAAQCKGCGICAVECPRGAVRMVRT